MKKSLKNKKRINSKANIIITNTSDIFKNDNTSKTENINYKNIINANKSSIFNSTTIANKKEYLINHKSKEKDLIQNLDINSINKIKSLIYKKAENIKSNCLEHTSNLNYFCFDCCTGICKYCLTNPVHINHISVDKKKFDIFDSKARNKLYGNILINFKRSINIYNNFPLNNIVNGNNQSLNNSYNNSNDDLFINNDLFNEYKNIIDTKFNILQAELKELQEKKIKELKFAFDNNKEIIINFNKSVKNSKLKWDEFIKNNLDKIPNDVKNDVIFIQSFDIISTGIKCFNESNKFIEYIKNYKSKFNKYLEKSFNSVKKAINTEILELKTNDLFSFNFNKNKLFYNKLEDKIKENIDFVDNFFKLFVLKSLKSNDDKNELSKYKGISKTVNGSLCEISPDNSRLNNNYINTSNADNKASLINNNDNNKNKSYISSDLHSNNKFININSKEDYIKNKFLKSKDKISVNIGNNLIIGNNTDDLIFKEDKKLIKDNKLLFSNNCNKIETFISPIKLVRSNNSSINKYYTKVLDIKKTISNQYYNKHNKIDVKNDLVKCYSSPNKLIIKNKLNLSTDNTSVDLKVNKSNFLINKVIKARIPSNYANNILFIKAKDDHQLSIQIKEYQKLLRYHSKHYNSKLNNDQYYKFNYFNCYISAYIMFINNKELNFDIIDKEEAESYYNNNNNNNNNKYLSLSDLKHFNNKDNTEIAQSFLKLLLDSNKQLSKANSNLDNYNKTDNYQEIYNLFKPLPGTTNIQLYDSESNKIFKINIESIFNSKHKNLPYLLFPEGLRSIMINLTIYIFGGKDINKEYNSILMYEIDKQDLIYVGDMQYSRSYFSLLHDKERDCIYLIGGENNKSCEKFDLKLRKSYLLPYMNISRCNPTLYIHKNTFLYVFGGYRYGLHINNLNNSIERLLICEAYNTNNKNKLTYINKKSTFKNQSANKSTHTINCIWDKIDILNDECVDLKYDYISIMPFTDDFIFIGGGLINRRNERCVNVLNMNNHKISNLDKSTKNYICYKLMNNPIINSMFNQILN